MIRHESLEAVHTHTHTHTHTPVFYKRNRKFKGRSRKI